MAEPDGLGGTTLTVHSFGEALDDSLCGVLGFRYHEAYRDGTNTRFLFLHDTGHHRIDLEQCLVCHEPKDPDELGGYIDDPTYWNPTRTPFYHRETLSTPDVLELPYGRIVPYTSVGSDIDRLGNAVRTVSVALDAEGRKSREVSRTRREGAGFDDWLELDSTVYAYASVVLPNGVQVKRPSSVKTWHRLRGCGQAPWHRTEYAYASGRLSTETASDSYGTVSSTSYTYGAFGQPLTVSLAPYGLDTATTVYGYDGRGRFVTSVTDPLGNTRTTAYEGRTGLPDTETDINGLTTSYRHDALGRVTGVTRPDGTVRNTAYEWNGTAAFGDAVWCVRETGSGMPESRTWFDVLGREVHSYVAGRGYHDVAYDSLGRVVGTTAVPYSNANELFVSKAWRETAYDAYGRVTAERGPYANLSYAYGTVSTALGGCYATVTDSIRDTRRTRTWDAAGRLAQAEDAGGTVAYSYGYATRSGRILDSVAVACGGATTVVFSDIRGNRVRIGDPDAGTVESAYDALGRLTEATDANGVTTTHAYDLLGRVTRTVRTDGVAGDTVAYVYDSAPGKGKGRLHKVRHNGADETVHAYDNLGRLSETVVADGQERYVQQYAYDAAGRLLLLTYPDGFAVRHAYNGYGELLSLTDDATDSLLYAVDTRDKWRHPLKCRYGNGTGVEYAYDAYGLLTGIRNGDVTDAAHVHDLGHDVTYTIGGEYRQLSYTYDARGFVATRAEANAGQTEAYAYDALDRLVSHTVNGVAAATLTYDGTGNIDAKTGVGSYSYGDAGPHAVTGLAGVIGCPVPNAACDVSYGLWNRPVSIAENGHGVSLDYGADGQRRHTRFLHNNVLQKAVTRVSPFHEVETTGGTTRSLDYVYAEGRVVAVHVSNGNADSLYCVLTDHLGSWEKVMDWGGNTVQQTHFDPWGNRMSYTAWNTRQTQVTFPFSRGFTGHEHYDRFHIVNANARLYDPVLGRFFSPDPFVQMPDFTQSYNRYSYCMNNPVMYSDPDGEVFVIDDIIAAAVLGAIFNGFSQIVAGNVNNVGDFFLAAGIGALSGAAGLTVGSGINATIAGGGFASGFVGSATITATGFWAGAGTGAASGFASGIISGTGNSLLAGKSFGKSLQDGLKEGVIGLGSGSVIGGLCGGIDAAINHREFFTGNAKQYDIFPANYASIDGGTEMFLNADDYTVVNNSDHVVYYKPEDGKYGVGEYRIDPHKGIKVNVDGLATCKYTDKVYKVPGKYGYHPQPIIANNGEVYFSKLNRAVLKTFSLANYHFGWMTMDQLDPTWENLFLSALLIK